MTKTTIALDAMGGDKGARIVIPAALNALKKYPDLCLILVGDQKLLQTYLYKFRHVDRNRLKIHHASEVVEMDEKPSEALRKKKDSSMRVAINLVKEGDAKACVSAGNTGALMATAHFVLKSLPGINRPAIITSIPANNKFKRVRMLDLGANVDSSAQTLEQFAIMGSVFTSAVDGVKHPKVALLNIGEEAIKGNEQVKKTAELLSVNKSIHYVGYVEGDAIFKGEADVIVCDGFVGNVALKTMEGLAKFISQLIKSTFKQTLMTRIAALFSIFVLKSLKKQMNPDRYNGATLIGLRGIVIKSHGNTSIEGFEHAIEVAISEAKHNVPERIKNEVAKLVRETHESS